MKNTFLLVIFETMKKMFRLLFCCYLLLVHNACVQSQTVDVETFQKGLENKNAQFLDVRSAEEFASGHIKGAMLAPIQDGEEFNRRINALDKKKPVFVYCLSGGRSKRASSILREKGFTEVNELEGGITAWRAEGKEIEGNNNTVQITPAAYQEMLKVATYVLVDIGAPWCPPCRKMEPVYKKMQQQFSNKIHFIKVDGGVQTLIMQDLQVLHMPTFILYKEGKEVWRAEGILEEQEMEAAIKKQIN
ncbi:MAG: hypothetical protein RLZ39_87 [Bacteroidota bacterium]|jgi:rhodanese-related sulfurtransferase